MNETYFMISEFVLQGPENFKYNLLDSAIEEMTHKSNNLES